MKKRILTALVIVGVALLMWAFSIRGKEGAYLFSGGSAILAGSIAAFALDAIGKDQNSLKTNAPAIVGAVIGLVLGGYWGSKSSLGATMISIFNPDLPEQDFGSGFGSIGGALIGAAALALLGAAFNLLVVRPINRTPAPESEDTIQRDSKSVPSK